MGLLRAEEHDLKTAEEHLKAALKADPQMAQAAYNLCVILFEDRIDEAPGYCKKAAEIRPDQARHAYTLAFCRRQRGDLSEAASVLHGLVINYPA
jgi:tetratricopeptide (TPR) repeat protein